MHTLFRFKTYELIFLFYRKFIFASTVVTLIQYTILRVEDISAMFSKILLIKSILFGLLFLFYLDVGLGQRFIFYKNFGISRIQLFLVSFFWDALLTFFTILILNLF